MNLAYSVAEGHYNSAMRQQVTCAYTELTDKLDIFDMHGAQPGMPQVSPGNLPDRHKNSMGCWLHIGIPGGVSFYA
jgi:hypothetical protein